MLNPPKHFTIVDPRTFDGNPYEVAERAILQTTALLNLAVNSIDSTAMMALNSDLERQLALGEESDPTTSVLFRRLCGIQVQLSELARQLEVIRRAAVYDPKHPPTEHTGG